MRDPDAVREMFSSISGRYDLLNRLLSGGLDRGWRRRAVKMLDPALGQLVADLCGGTGELALACARRGARVVCCDFSAPMLARAKAKLRTRSARPHRQEGNDAGCLIADALRLPLREAAFDGVTIGFGLRNLRTIEEGLAEMRRIL